MFSGFTNSKVGKAVLLASLVILVLTPFVFFLVESKIPKARSWYNDSWEYRRPITLSNSGSTKTNYAVLVTLDTQALISAGKIQNTCADIRLLDENDTTVLDHWIEGGCNTTNTRIWAKVPSLPNDGKTIYLYYGNGAATDNALAWAGNFNLLSSSSCPNGWSRNSDMDGKYIVGDDTYGLTGGVTASHDHSGSTTCSLGNPSATSAFGVTGTEFDAATATHTHGNVSGTIASYSPSPKYIETLVCEKSKLDISSGAISLFTSSPSGNWSTYSDANTRLLKANSVAGATGGVETHSHTVSGSGTTGGVTGTATVKVPFGIGTDGAVTISSNTNINTTNRISGRSCADGGDAVNYSVTALSSNTATLSSSPSAGCLAAGDLVLLINLQGTTTNKSNVGNYEIIEVQSVSTNTVTFAANKAVYYGDSGSSDSNIGTASTNQRVMLQRVPQYTDLTVNNGISFYPSAWNGTKGGVLAFRANGTVTVNGTITASAYGFRGGNATANDEGGYGGESYCSVGGVAGSGNGASGGGATSGTGGTGSCGGGGGGGPSGGTGGTGSAASGGSGAGGGRIGAGGGGAGYGSAGTGGYGYDGQASSGGTNVSSNGANGASIARGGGGGAGGTYGVGALWDMYLGSGGGGGGGYGGYVSGAGGVGGGIVYIAGTTVTVAGAVSANGANGGNYTGGIYGGGGGASGGSVLIESYSSTLGTSLVTATGGSGGTGAWNGGVGGAGRIGVYANTITGTTNPSAVSGALTNSLVVGAHTHSYSADASTSTNNDMPPYVDYMLYSAGANAAPESGMVAMFDVLPPLGWSLESGLDGYFPRGNSSYGGSGGSSSHTHTFNVTAADPGATGVRANSGDARSSVSHTHTCVATSASRSNLPEYYSVIFGRRIVNTEDGIGASVGSEQRDVPIAPSMTSGQGLSTTSIRWNFVDNSTNETGFKVYDLSNNLMVTCPTPDISFCDEIGLSPNVSYSRKVAAYNAKGYTLSESSVSRYTLIQVPTISPTNPSLNSIDIGVTGVSNLSSGSSGLYYDCTSSSCDTGLNSWITDVSDTSTGLSANTQYAFRVKSRNGDGVETAYSDSSLLYTLADVPTQTFGTIMSTSVTATAGNTANLGSGQSAVLFTCVTEGCAESGLWDSDGSEVIGSLSPNTQYEFNVKARNGDGVETASSTSQLKYTLANVPLIPTAEQVNTTTLKVKLNADQNSNSVATEYAVYEQGASKYVNISTGALQNDASWGTYAQWGGANGIEVSNLSSGTEYTFKVKARNGESVETDFGPTVSSYTELNIPTAGTPSALSTSSIRWNFTDNEGNNQGIRIYNSENTLIKECEGASLTYCDETGLNLNVQYTRKFVSYNAGGESEYSGSVSAYTLAEVPLAPNLSFGITQATVTVFENGNPVGTEYAIYVSNYSQYVNESGQLTGSAVWRTYADWGGADGITVLGLLPNTIYDFKVKARNGDNVSTALSTMTTGSTLVASVPGPTYQAMSSSSFRFWVQRGTNPIDTEFAVYVEELGKYVYFYDCSLVDDPAFTSYRNWVVEGRTPVYKTLTGLSVNTQYSLKSLPRNHDEINGDFSPLTSIYTFANVPSSPTVSAVSEVVLKTVINQNSNPSNTEYAIMINDTSYINHTTGTTQESADWQTYTTWGGADGIGVVGLSPNSTYNIKVKARNGDNVATAYTTNVSKYTLANTPASPTIDPITSTSTNVTLGSNGNPASTQFALQDYNSSKYLNTSGAFVDDAVWATITSWGGEDGIVVSGLTPGTEYAFRAKAKNAESVETAFSEVSGFEGSLPAPTIGTPSALSSSSIRWTFTDNATDEIGFRVLDGDGVQKAQCVGGNLTYCDEYGLDPNVSYTRKVVAYDAGGNGDESGTATISTLAGTPNSPTVTTVSNVSLNIVINGASNPANTQFAIQEAVSGNYVNKTTGVLQATADWGTYAEFGSTSGRNVVGLFANALYTFKVKARNLDNVETDFSGVVSRYTAAISLPNPTVTPSSASSILVKINNAGNPPFTQYSIVSNSGKYVQKGGGVLSSAAVWGTHAEFGGNVGVSVSGLLPNASYSFLVKVRNGEGTISDTTNSIPTYTYSAIPLSPIVNVISATTTNIVVRGGDNPTGTEIAVWESQNGRYVTLSGTFVTAPVWATVAQWGGADGINITSLARGGGYTFLAKSRNANGLESGLTTNSTFYSSPLVPLQPITVVPSTTSVKLYLSIPANHTSVLYSIEEVNSGRFVSFQEKKLVATQVWGTYQQYGGESGIEIKELSSASNFIFRVKAKNLGDTQTSYGPEKVVETSAMLLNTPANVSVELAGERGISPATFEGATRGDQLVRAFEGEYVVADLPITFDSDKDWSDVVIDLDTIKDAAVTKIASEDGMYSSFTMYLPKDTTQYLRVCPEAESIDDVTGWCANGMMFEGPYPETKTVEGSEVKVSVETVDGVEYWKVEGLKGTGIIGLTDEDIETMPIDDTEEGGPELTFDLGREIVSQVKNKTVKKVTKTIVVDAPEQTVLAAKGIGDVIDTTPLGQLEESPMTIVATTTTVATVSVGLAIFAGGFSNIPYLFIQMVISLLGFFGFRREGKPCGFVYDAVSKKPVSRAVVRVYDVNDKLVWTDVTDSYGMFNANIKAGKYKILVKKGGYDFPSKIITAKTDFPFEPVYRGEEISLNKKSQILYVIPLDPKNLARAKKSAARAVQTVKRLFGVLNILVFVLGLVIGIYAYAKYPSYINLIALLFYIPALVVLFRNLFIKKGKVGQVIDGKGKGIEGVTIVVKDLTYDRFVAKFVTEEDGRYQFILPNGAYQVEIVDDKFKAIRFEGGSNLIQKHRKNKEIIISKKILAKKK